MKNHATEASIWTARCDVVKVNTRGNPYRIRPVEWPPTSSRGREDVVAMLHELYVAYPDENHAVLAQALLQARKNISPLEGDEAIRQEVGRLLGVLAVIRLRTCEA
jgi:hypothetical protein